jgi:hypothetical protein
MWNRGVAALTFLLLGTATGLAYPIQGPGATSCAEFAKMFQADPATTEIMFYSWAQGFMSAVNISAKANNRPMKELAGVMVDQERFLRTYCANNPLKNYMDGIMKLYEKLPVSAPSSN